MTTLNARGITAAEILMTCAIAVVLSSIFSSIDSHACVGHNGNYKLSEIREDQGGHSEIRFINECMNLETGIEPEIRDGKVVEEF